MSHQMLQVELAERPSGNIVPGKTFRQRLVPAPTAADLQDGQVLVEALYLSLDPAMRGWLNDKRSYVPPVQIGEVMRGNSVARVLAVRGGSGRLNVGDIVNASTGFRELAVLDEAKVDPPPQLLAGSKITDILGVLGFTGLTAYFGIEKIGQPQPGETVVVTAAAGATGSVVAQIAKLKGARVVGVAGSDEKVRWLKEELGLDEALNYKDPELVAKFKAATPNYINVFWDNVGGEQLDLALSRAAPFSRFVMCGGISQYNNTGVVQGPKNYLNIVTQRIKMQGFIVFDYVKEFAAARKQLLQWLAEGKIKRQETIVKGGLRVAEEAFANLFTGSNIGKLLVEVKNPEEAPKL